MKTEIKFIETNLFELGVPLILIIENDGYQPFLIGAMTEEGGGYPLLDFEIDRLFMKMNLVVKDRDYEHLSYGY